MQGRTGKNRPFWSTRWLRNKAYLPPKRGRQRREERHFALTIIREERVFTDQPILSPFPGGLELPCSEPSSVSDILSGLMGHLAPYCNYEIFRLSRRKKWISKKGRRGEGTQRPKSNKLANVLSCKISHGHCPSMSSWDNNSDSWTIKKGTSSLSIYHELSLFMVKQTRII